MKDKKPLVIMCIARDCPDVSTMTIRTLKDGKFSRFTDYCENHGEAAMRASQTRPVGFLRMLAKRVASNG